MTLTQDEFRQKMLSDSLHVAADSKKDAERTDNGLGAARGFISINDAHHHIEALRNKVLAAQSKPSVGGFFTHKTQPAIPHPEFTKKGLK